MAKRKSRFILVSLFLIALVVVYVGVLPFIIAHHNEQHDPVVITKGSSVSQIAKVLADADVISSTYAFIIAAKLSDQGKRLQSGIYQFPNDLTITEVLQIVADGSHQVEKWVTFPEGSTVKRIASIIQRKLDIDSAKVVALTKDPKFIAKTGFRVKSLEGYLLPDTYRFKITASAEDIIGHMAEMMKEFTGRYKGRMDSVGLSLHKILTMASIVEGETRLAEERARVAGVYYNRLRIGMLLQADPTVQYIIPDGPRRLLYSDLRRDSKYNTYKYKGLPPGPINNPGREAIKAALYPEHHTFIYFVADGKGGHIFSRNANEHQRAVAQYRKYQRSQRVN